MKPTIGQYRLVQIVICVFLFVGKIVYAQCGSERWEVKTLQDAEVVQINFTPKNSTVHEQLGFTKPRYFETNPRAATEKQVYVMDCMLLKYKAEGDKDWHLVVQDLTTNEKMVVEIPDPTCDEVKGNSHFNKLKLVRTRIRARLGPFTESYRKAPLGTKVHVTGVGFFDKSNHPIGFKGREIHPVLNLSFP